MLKGQLDKVMVTTPSLEAHNICGSVKDGTKMRGQSKEAIALKQDTWSTKSLSGSAPMKGSSK